MFEHRREEELRVWAYLLIPSALLGFHFVSNLLVTAADHSGITGITSHKDAAFLCIIPKYLNLFQPVPAVELLLEQEVYGSSPLVSTTKSLETQRFQGFSFLSGSAFVSNALVTASTSVSASMCVYMFAVVL